MQYNIKNKLKQLIFNFILFISIAILFTACPTPPEFDNIPAITFNQLEYSQIVDSTSTSQNLTVDVLDVTIGFEDGDGDLGLRSSETNPPYQIFNILLDENSELILFGSRPGLPEYNYYDYFITDDSVVINETLLTNDTLLVEFNERHFNIFVDFFYQPPGATEFVQFEWETEPGFYQTFNYRFPILNTENYDRPLNGTLSYKMESEGFRIIFGGYPLYLEIYIIDRAGNVSNTIKTETIIIPRG